MLKMEIIGNLGADAEVQNYNGNQFLSFRVAHSEKYVSQDGQQHTNTIWVSCSYNGNAANVIQYLKKGAKVFCRGFASFKVYSSPKTKQMEVGVSIRVQELELCGSSTAINYPLTVHDFNGLQYLVNSDGLVTPKAL